MGLNEIEKSADKTMEKQAGVVYRAGFTDKSSVGIGAKNWLRWLKFEVGSDNELTDIRRIAKCD